MRLKMIQEASRWRRLRWAWGLGIAVCTLAAGARIRPASVNSYEGQARRGGSSLFLSWLPWHKPVLDKQGKLLAWYEPGKNLGYDKVLRLVWNFIEYKVPNEDKTGLKVYLVNSCFNGNPVPNNEWQHHRSMLRAPYLQGNQWQHNPAMLFAAFVDSLLGWYPYSGDEKAVNVVGQMLDYQLAHGTTPADWNWASVPFATSCGNDRNYGRCLQFSGVPWSFYGGIMPDKVGELGAAYVLYYEMTGEKKYLDAALKCAQALAKHIRPGDADHTPWPLRVDGRTGKVIYDEEYGGMEVAPVRLFDELIRLHAGDVASFQRARNIAWKWILRYPMRDDKWGGYFEDVGYGPAHENQTVPTMTARYILNRDNPATVDPNWRNDVRHIINWTREKFGVGPYFGAWGINEQTGCCSPVGLGSDTSRWGAINAMYYEKTGDVQARKDAFRSLNYATYFAASDGKASCCGNLFGGNQYWFSDGYADYSRHFSWAMCAIPAFAPKGENHLLCSSSVVQKVSYKERNVSYRTFDQTASEVLRLHFRPARVTSGGKPLPKRKVLERGATGYSVLPLGSGDYVVRVQHTNSREVNVEGKQ